MDGLYTLKQFCEEQKLFSESSIRSMIYNQTTNGLKDSGAIIRYGRKILIDKEKFFLWIKGMNSGN